MKSLEISPLPHSSHAFAVQLPATKGIFFIHFFIFVYFYFVTEGSSVPSYYLTKMGCAVRRISRILFAASWYTVMCTSWHYLQALI